METRLTAALERAGVTGFTVLPVLGGSGRSGRWTREGQVGRQGMVAVVCLIRPERLDTLLTAAFEVVERHIGVVSVSDRASRGAYEDKGIPALKEWLGRALRNPIEWHERLIHSLRGSVVRLLQPV